jgi:hypothetical protein
MHFVLPAVITYNAQPSCTTKMNKQDADKFKDKVDELIHTYILEGGQVDKEKFLVKIYDYAVEQSRNYIPIGEELSITHGPGVNATQLDFNIIMLSIISISWAVRMGKIKSEEGQCYTHTTNCDETRKFHRDIYHQWSDIVEEALEALRSDPPDK